MNEVIVLDGSGRATNGRYYPGQNPGDRIDLNGKLISRIKNDNRFCPNCLNDSPSEEWGMKHYSQKWGASYYFMCPKCGEASVSAGLADYTGHLERVNQRAALSDHSDDGDAVWGRRDRDADRD